MRTRSKIIILFTSIFFMMVFMFSLSIYVFISRYSYTDFYKRLEIRSYSAAKSELDPTSGDFIKEFKGEYLEPLIDEKHYILPFISEDSLFIQANIKGIPKPLVEEIIKFNLGTYQDGEYFYSGILYEKGNESFLVITSAINYYYGHHTAYLRNLLITLSVISLILIVFISYWFSKRMIVPIKRVTDKVNKIGSENLHLRLQVQKEDDEMGELVKTFNNMLDRLETSFETQNNFISNASHELNTPLTSIIGEADVTLARPREKEEYVETLKNILFEAEKLDQKTKALLYLAQTGFNGKTINFSIVRMDQLIFDVQSTMNRLHPNNKVAIDLSKLPDAPEKLKVYGNEQLLHLAVSNIVLNAYKYSNNKKVVVSITQNDGEIIIEVNDNGIGIPINEQKYIFDPFFRASNTGNFEGYGIGLPLTRNIVKLHNGDLKVISNEEKGTIVTLRFPVIDPSMLKTVKKV